ncbi:TPA: hypothetical protein KKX32_002278 [Legionella pneumophila]|uniref:hypothetical protein n=1 Tax=Legionella pneumophila TaxID=446 RepID=UPI000B336D49|nr:hypothetical protein [Legionella pneumophila]MBN5930315.1 hypothetical protein [Legionella pneumophila]MCZ4678760.1 hypothetical protein [Legionella pneumophila]MCZ4703492.1 hypothetical protein [Legionella pneumophila]MCZ4750533.1 hypothetical protein [Legionella pneumophila]MDW8862379.1 hypothetical protein [Legionella pneumophila]
MLHLENNKVQIWEQYRFREYFVLSYLVRQDRCRFDAKYMRAKEDEFLCVTADNSSVTRDKQV